MRTKIWKNTRRDTSPYKKITLKIPPETGVQIASDAITIKNIIIEGENGVEIFKSEK